MCLLVENFTIISLSQTPHGVLEMKPGIRCLRHSATVLMLTPCSNYVGEQKCRSPYVLFDRDYQFGVTQVLGNYPSLCSLDPVKAFDHREKSITASLP